MVRWISRQERDEPGKIDEKEDRLKGKYWDTQKRGEEEEKEEIQRGKQKR